MIGYGFDGDSWHYPPFIALELAHGDLDGLVRFERQPTISIETRCHLLGDIASALDAIHQVGLIHGDLKPANVLVFKEISRWVAKLSDFGSSTGAGRSGNGFGGRGTVGWRAPELRRHHEAGHVLDPLLLDRLDSYSFGLMAWFLFCSQSADFLRLTEEDDALDFALTALHSQHTTLSENLVSALEHLFRATLALEPPSRTTELSCLLSRFPNNQESQDPET